jgi:hypothetical protein
MSGATDAGKRLYDESVRTLNVIGPLALKVSKQAAGKPTDRQGTLASLIFMKVCAHSRSIIALTESLMFDHSAIIASSRMVLEGMTMFFYIRETVDHKVWSLRDLVLRLHITTLQITGMRAFRSKDSLMSFTEGRHALISQIRAHPLYRTLNEEQRKKITSGNEIFVGGMRKAAMNTGAWSDEAMFTSVYSYLSSHAHSAPLSFVSLQRLYVDYHKPVDYQFGLAAFGIEIANGCLRRTTLRYLDDVVGKYPEIAAAFDKAVVDQQREDDNNFGVVFNAKMQS